MAKSIKSIKQNPTQQIRAMLASGDFAAIDDLLLDPKKVKELTLPAQAELADGLIYEQRWRSVARAFDAGSGDIFSGWLSASGYGSRKRMLSERIDLATARKVFRGASEPMFRQVAKDLANRTIEGDWAVWEKHKSNPSYVDALFKSTWAESTLLSSLLVAQYQNGASKMPADLKKQAVALASGSHYWDIAACEPRLTQWGSINRRDAEEAGPIHYLFLKGEFEAAAEAAAIFGVEEYGSSGRGPIDSALMSGWLEAVEAAMRGDPLSILRPVNTKPVSAWSPPSQHVPFKGFLADLSASSARMKAGLTIRHPSLDEDFCGLHELTQAWVGGAYAAQGTPAQRALWEGEWTRFTAAADTGKLGFYDAIYAIEGMVDDAIARLGIEPKTTASYRAWMATPEYAIALSREDLGARRVEAEAAEARAKADALISKLASEPASSKPARESSWQRGATTAEEFSRILDKIDAATSRSPEPSAAAPLSAPELAMQAGRGDASAVPSSATIAPPPAGPISSDHRLVDKLRIKRTPTKTFSRAHTEALGRAVSQGDIAAARQALAGGADPEGKVGGTDRMLHRAASLSNEAAALSIGAMLLAAGAKPEQADAKGAFAADRSRHQSVAEMLREAQRTQAPSAPSSKP